MGLLCLEVPGLPRSINGVLAAAVCQAAAGEKHPFGGWAACAIQYDLKPMVHVCR